MFRPAFFRPCVLFASSRLSREQVSCFVAACNGGNFLTIATQHLQDDFLRSVS